MPETLSASGFGHLSIRGVTDGSRTHDLQSHNLALCQLSYGHHATRRSQYSLGLARLSNGYCLASERYYARLRAARDRHLRGERPPAGGLGRLRSTV